MDNLVELYCHIDDFCKGYTAEQQKKMLTLKRAGSKRTRNKPCKISLAEIITILVLFHQLRYREFKAFYYGYVCQWLTKTCFSKPARLLADDRTHGKSGVSDVRLPTTSHARQLYRH